MGTGIGGEEAITPLAITNWRDIRKKFGIRRKNRRGHIYVVGKTGTGKSSLMGNMMLSDLEQGNGFALIDPHGDLAAAVLDRVPVERAADVIVFDPSDLESPVGLNPLEVVHPDRHHLAVSGLISVFKKIWPDSWGPRLEHILRHALFTLMEAPGSTLLDVPRLLTDPRFRQAALAGVTRQEVRDFWSTEFERYSVWLKSEATAPILNKVGQFLTSLPVRNILGQTRSAFSLRKVMDEGQVLIVNLAKGRIGEDNCALLGAMLVTQIELAALSRADTPESSRTPFYLYVDEAHNFLTDSFADVLSESRKYGLNLTLANQFTHQLDESMRSAILGNVGTLISFRVGVEDAELLAKEFAPAFKVSNLLNLPNFHICLKLMIDGTASHPFSATTIPLPEARESHAEEIVRASRERYAKARSEVEAMIAARRRAPDAPSRRQPTLFD